MQETISFSAWVKQRRHALDLTQKEIAWQIGCVPSTIEKIEQGVLRPSRQIATLLAERLEIAPDERPAFVQWARTVPVRARPVPASDTFAASSRSTALPIPPTRLIGRKEDLARLYSMLSHDDTRLVTLTGPGGTGKTRLGLHVAGNLLDDFSDGVWFVELSTITEPGLVVSTIAQTLGVKEAAGQAISETLQTYLMEKRLLLLLDNFEQVVEAAEEVGRLLGACAGVKVLATSRVPLRIRGEKEYAVSPLELPDIKQLPTVECLTQYDAVRLFIDRATDVKADFQVTNKNALSVAEICVRLDGLPLAIELAAAHIKMLPPHTLLTRLSHRLALLTNGARDLPARQQTLRATIAWSYDLLDEGHKQLLHRMAVFMGGRTLEAMETVCNYDGELQVDVFDGAEILLSNNLLQQREGSDGELRIWMLETIQEYAREKLQESGEGGALQKAHALYFMKLAEEAEPHLTSKQQQKWLDILSDQYDNIRAALAWTGEQARGDNQGSHEAAEIGLRIGGAIYRFWFVKSLFTEGRQQLQRALSLPEGVLQVCSPASRAKALCGKGVLAYRQGDYSSASALSEAALVLGREAGDKQSIFFSLNLLGIMAQEQNDYTSARTLYEEGLALGRELGDTWSISAMLSNLGGMAYEQGDYTSARALHEESLALGRELGDTWGISYCLNGLGNVAYEQGDYTSARALHEESLALRGELGDQQGIAACLAGLGGVAVKVGEVEKGATLLGGVEGLLHNLGAVLDHEDRLAYEHALASARSLLSEEAFEKAWEKGLGMSMEQAIAYALDDTPEC